MPALLISAFIYTLGEELGWRAYALPCLQEGSTALAAGLIAGLLWGLWHVPTWVAQGYSGTDLVPPVVSVIAGSLLFTWIYNGSGGSLLLVWIFHTASTLTGYVLLELPTPTEDLVRLATVVGVVLIAGPTDLSRSRPRQRLTAMPMAGVGGG